MRSSEWNAGVPLWDRSGSVLPRNDKVGGNTDLWFIAVVFFSTLAILAIQVVLGWWARSLVLLADSAHSAADVLSYGLNWGVEYLKADRLESARSSDLQSRVAACLGRFFSRVRGPGTEIDVATLADEVGCILSTVVLVVATGSAATGAARRILGGEAHKSDQDDYSEIGPALLSFSCLSTLANVGTLVLYVRWKRTDNSVEAAGVEAASVESPLPPRAVGREVPDVFHRQDVAPPDDIPLVIPATSPASRPRTPGRKKKKRGALDLNLRTEFAGEDMRTQSLTSRGTVCSNSTCRDPDCVTPAAGSEAESYLPAPDVFLGLLREVTGRNNETGAAGFAAADTPAFSSQASTAAGSACNSPNCEDPACSAPGSDVDDNAPTPSRSSWLPWDTWQPALHVLVHPGCTCGSAGHYESPGGASSREAQANMNMLATLLHLVADVLRGIVIFAVACIIQIFKVPCPDKWDAWCTMLVAVFVILGSVALLGRAARTCYARILPSSDCPAAGRDELPQPL